jgi:hypothetical protein
VWFKRSRPENPGFEVVERTEAEWLAAYQPSAERVLELLRPLQRASGGPPRSYQRRLALDQKIMIAGLHLKAGKETRRERALRTRGTSAKRAGVVSRDQRNATGDFPG